MHSRTKAPAKLVSTTIDFRAFVAEAPHLTIPRQRTLETSLFKCTSENSQGHISKTRRWIFFLNDENLDKCLSKKNIGLATPALWLSSPHWAKCMTNSYPRRSSSKRHAKTTAIIRRRPVTCVYLDLGISQTAEQPEKFLDLGTVTRPPSSIYARVNCFVIRDWCTRVQGHPRNLFRRPWNFGLSSQKHHTWPYHASVLWQTYLFKCSSETSEGHISETTRWIFFFKRWKFR